MKIYIAGPITGREEAARKQFADTAMQIREAFPDIDIVNPFELDHDHDKDWESYMSVCIKELMTCNTLYLLPGWTDSPGARIEVMIASRMGMDLIDALGGEITEVKSHLSIEFENNQHLTT